LQKQEFRKGEAQMRTIIMSLMVLLAIFSGIASAEEKSDFYTTFSAQVLSKYLTSSGFDVSNGDPSMQFDLALHYQNFRFEIWNATELDGSFRHEAGNETDFIIAYNGDIPLGMNLDLGIMYIDVPGLFADDGNDAFQPFMEVQKEFELTDKLSVSPLLRGEFNFYTNGEFDSAVHVGFRHSWNFYQDFSLGGKVAVVFSDVGGPNDGSNFLYCGGLNWKVNDTINADLLMVKFTVPINGMGDRDDDSSIGTGLNFKF